MIHDFPLTIPQQQKSDKIKILQIKTEQRTESKKNPKIKWQFQDIISNNKAKIRKKNQNLKRFFISEKTTKTKTIFTKLNDPKKKQKQKISPTTSPSTISFTNFN